MIWNIFYASINTYSLLLFLITGMRIMAVPVYLPFIDPQTDFGFILNVCFHEILGIIGFYTFITYDCITLISGLHFGTSMDVLIYKLDEVAKYTNEKGYRDDVIDKALKEIIDDFEEYKKFMYIFNDYRKAQSAVVVFITVFAVCVNILLVLTSDNKLQIIIGCLSTVQMFYHCIVPCCLGSYFDYQVSIFFTKINKKTKKFKIFTEKLYTREIVLISLVQPHQ